MAPMVPNTANVRAFKSEVQSVTERDFGVKLDDTEDVDPAAAHLYDAILLWAKAYSQVSAANGMLFS